MHTTDPTEAGLAAPAGRGARGRQASRDDGRQGDPPLAPTLDPATLKEAVLSGHEHLYPTHIRAAVTSRRGGHPAQM